MARYRVKTRLVFEGSFLIEADNACEAQHIVMNDCGLVMNGNIHTTRNNEVIDWEFPCHADKEIVSVTGTAGIDDG